MLAHIRVSPQGFLALKFWVSGGWLVLWNSWFIVLKHFWLPKNQLQEQLILIGVLFSTSFLAFSITVFPEFRHLLVSKRRAHLYEPAPFLLLGLLTFLMGLAVLVRALLMFTGRLQIPELIMR